MGAVIDRLTFSQDQADYMATRHVQQKAVKFRA
jgi:hypothetical protein